MATQIRLDNIRIADSAASPLAERDAGAVFANTVIDLAQELRGPRIVAAATVIGHTVATLTTGEEKQYRRLGSNSRRRSWLAGRAVIKAARERLGLGTDTARLRFPHTCTSLTHAGGYAIAVTAPEGALSGLGVDLEAWRHTAAGITRFFLTAAECDWIAGRPTDQQERDRIRLWTVKEAVFKARPDNHGMTLNQFAVDDPSASSGKATALPRKAGRRTDSNRISYASKWTPSGCVSLAYLPIPRR